MLKKIAILLASSLFLISNSVTALGSPPKPDTSTQAAQAAQVSKILSQLKGKTKMQMYQYFKKNPSKRTIISNYIKAPSVEDRSIGDDLLCAACAPTLGTLCAFTGTGATIGSAIDHLIDGDIAALNLGATITTCFKKYCPSCY